MTYRARYTLFERALTSGKKVFYYQTYDDAGKRTSARSTGQTSITAARRFCNELLTHGKIIPASSDLFKTWAKNWWVWGKCRYIQSQRGNVGHTHADIQRSYLKNHIMPFFGPMRLSSIKPGDVENWIGDMLKRGKSASLTNHCLRTLKTMLNEAERLELIFRNPARTVKRLPENKKQKALLTVDEVEGLFNEGNFDLFWHGNILHYTLNLVAASTGLRMGELQALQSGNICPGYIRVTHSWTRQYGLVSDSQTKRHARDVPIPKKTEMYVQRLLETAENGFIFSLDREKPINYRSIGTFFENTLDRMDIDHERRNITFHSWRYWFNTIMRSQHIPDAKLRELTGHRGEKMTEQYTSFDISHYQDVRSIQESIFS